MSKGNKHPISLKGYKTLFDTLYAPLCLFANTYLNNMDVSKDVVQQVFIIIWEKRFEITKTSAIKSYIYTSVKNRCLDHLKSKCNRDVIGFTDHDLESLEDEEFFFSQITVVETYALLYEAIDQLPQKSKELITLSLKSYTNREIADEMEVSVNTVKSQKRIAYEKLRQSLSGFLSFF